jgi:hypothetical protein
MQFGAYAKGWAALEPAFLRHHPQTRQRQMQRIATVDTPPIREPVAMESSHHDNHVDTLRAILKALEDEAAPLEAGARRLATLKNAMRRIEQAVDELRPPIVHQSPAEIARATREALMAYTPATSNRDAA